MEYLIFPTIFLAITVPFILIQILNEVKKTNIIATSSNSEIKELNATMKYLKRKYRESNESET
jgi:hypothetical protein